jgi:SAM-dependent methyltransferase
MKECSKSITRRLADSRFVRRYFIGEGIDIGGKPDPLAIYREFFPLMNNVRTWDLEDGDAQFLNGVADNTYDFIHSSHCLEHLHDPVVGLKNWLRVLKDDGYLVITIPDEDLYEQGVFPSTFNLDHKWTFTLYKPTSWSDRSINVLDLVQELGSSAAVEKLELLDANYRYALPRYDQTLTPVAECGIELIIRKRSAAEVERKGLRSFAGQPDREMRIHLNQHRDDLQTLKSSNIGAPPFSNDDNL